MKKAIDYRAWASIDCKKMRGREACELVEKAVQILNEHGHDIIINNKSLAGFMMLGKNGNIKYEIGTKNIKDNQNKIFSMHEAIHPLVTCFHEVCGHGGQWRNESQKDTVLSKVLILNDLACKCSPDYYGIDMSCMEPEQTYFEQPHEIAAQYMGLKMTQKFLAAVYDEKTADTYLCQYVNLRIASGNSFIPVPDGYEMEIPADGRAPFMKSTEPFDNMDDIYEQFQKTFEEQALKGTEYQVTKYASDLLSDKIDKMDMPWERFAARHQINSISDRLTQAYLLAGVWLEGNEDWHHIKDLPVLKDMEFPDRIKDLIKNAPKPPDKKDLDLDQLTEDDLDFAEAVNNIPADTGPEL